MGVAARAVVGVAVTAYPAGTALAIGDESPASTSAATLPTSVASAATLPTSVASAATLSTSVASAISRRPHSCQKSFFPSPGVPAAAASDVKAPSAIETGSAVGGGAIVSSRASLSQLDEIDEIDEIDEPPAPPSPPKLPLPAAVAVEALGSVAAPSSRPNEALDAISERTVIVIVASESIERIGGGCKPPGHGSWRDGRPQYSRSGMEAPPMDALRTPV